MKNFAIGPVQSSDKILRIGSEQTPYFRTKEFSRIMLDNESLIQKMANAPGGSRTVFLTGSGTAAMEASVMNSFDEQDRVLVINGGNFGQRFVDICKIHKIPHTEIKLAPGKALTEEHLLPYDSRDYSGLLVNALETSTGVLFDTNMIGNFCKRNDIFLIVDAISSFLADPFDMMAVGAAILISSSQKAIACPPGISIIVLSPKAVKRIQEKEIRSLYFNLQEALIDGERGQTPFTPAVGILLQIHAQLTEIFKRGGVEREVARVRKLAEDFRLKIKSLPLKIATESLSNAVTPLYPANISAFEIFVRLKDEYGIWVCPNGGILKEKLFRVGHLGALTEEDNSFLVSALKDMHTKGLL